MSNMCTETIYNSHILLLLTDEQTGAVCTCVQRLSVTVTFCCATNNSAVTFCYCQLVNRLDQCAKVIL